MLLRLPRPVELALEPVGQHTVDDEAADIHAGLAQHLGRARRFFDHQPFRHRHQRKRRALPIHEHLAQRSQALVPALEGREHRVVLLGRFLRLRGTAIDLEHGAPVLDERLDPGDHRVRHAQQLERVPRRRRIERR